MFHKLCHWLEKMTFLYNKVRKSYFLLFDRIKQSFSLFKETFSRHTDKKIEFGSTQVNYHTFRLDFNNFLIYVFIGLQNGGDMKFVRCFYDSLNHIRISTIFRPNILKLLLAFTIAFWSGFLWMKSWADKQELPLNLKCSQNHSMIWVEKLNTIVYIQAFFFFQKNIWVAFLWN